MAGLCFVALTDLEELVRSEGSALKYDYDVPSVAVAVHDRNWPGTGNWGFNTAFAGKFPGMRAFVTRLADVAQLEERIVAGVCPVTSGVRLVERTNGGSQWEGTWSCALGFNDLGDVIVNDPWAEPMSPTAVRRTIPRERMDAAWLGRSEQST